MRADGQYRAAGPSFTLDIIRSVAPTIALTSRLIERKIEQKYVHTRLTQESKQAALGVVGDKLADTLFRQVARLRYARDLEQGSLWRDMRIET